MRPERRAPARLTVLPLAILRAAFDSSTLARRRVERFHQPISNTELALHPSSDRSMRRDEAACRE
jgi:hypothetical protein